MRLLLNAEVITRSNRKIPPSPPVNVQLASIRYGVEDMIVQLSEMLLFDMVNTFPLSCQFNDRGVDVQFLSADAEAAAQ